MFICCLGLLPLRDDNEGNPLKRLLCGSHRMVIILDNKYLLKHSFIFLTDNSCHSGPINVTAGHVTKISTKYTECGTTETQTADQIVYTNKVFYQEKERSDELYAILVKCNIRRIENVMGKNPLKLIEKPKIKFTKSKFKKSRRKLQFSYEQHVCILRLTVKLVIPYYDTRPPFLN